MSSNNHTFTIRDERLEWDPEDPWSAFESPEESSDSDGEGDTVVKSSERRRTLLIAGEGALAGGLLSALVTAAVTLSSASGAHSPQPAAHPAPAQRRSSAVVLGPAVTPHKAKPTVTHKAHKAEAPRHHKEPRATHPRNAPRKHTKPASTARIHSKPAHHDRRSSK
jgi:hypothetical protein